MNDYVVVVGAGNAGLCAAISAAQLGKKVLVLEKSDFNKRGGNSSLTMNFRFPHDNFYELSRLISEESYCVKENHHLKENYKNYTKNQFLKDLIHTSSGRCDIELAKTLSEKSYSTILWMHSLGHRWTYKNRNRQHVSSLPIKIDGAGLELQRKSFFIAEKMGIKFSYKSKLISIKIKKGNVSELIFEIDKTLKKVSPRSVILACGGYQASSYLRSKFLGEEWKEAKLRGVPFNSGDWYTIAMENNLQLSGDFEHCHSTPQSHLLEDFMLPGNNEDSQSNSRYMFSMGITVNKNGERFFDEGKEYPNFNYAQFGEEIQKQPDKVAYQLFDSSMVKYLPRSYFQKGDLFKSKSILALADNLSIDKIKLLKTIEEYNDSCENYFEKFSDKLDGMLTNGLSIKKSNWACKIISPPFYISPVKAGITFTYGGLKINNLSQVIQKNSKPVNNLFACGEIAGGLHYKNYAGGTGLMFGSVMGKIAGEYA